jgi:DNA-binding NtrC family response regulator
VLLLCVQGSWPGNIRELQNVIERSLILSETESFSVDQNWLSREPETANSSLAQKLAGDERAMIESALPEAAAEFRFHRPQPAGAHDRLLGSGAEQGAGVGLAQ